MTPYSLLPTPYSLPSCDLATLLLLTLLILIVTIAFHLSRQSEQQHRELTQLIDALAEMIGEAIDQNERKSK